MITKKSNAVAEHSKPALDKIPMPVPKPIAGAPQAIATEITPDMAERWLEKNSFNRPVHDSWCKEIGSIMKRGQWELNGETIIISDTGDILDGQHRLGACWLYAKVPFQSYVIIGMTKEVFATIDTGKKRSGADAFHIYNKMRGAETKYANAITAAAVTCIEYKLGSWKSRHSHLITNQDKVDFIENNPSLPEWVKKVRRSKKDWANAYAQNVGPVLFMGSRKFPMKAETFAVGWITGNDLPADSPILALRQRLATDKNLKKWDRMKLIIYAWNLHVHNESRTSLKMPAEMPVIAGTEPPPRATKEPKKRANLKAVKPSHTGARLRAV